MSDFTTTSSTASGPLSPILGKAFTDPFDALPRIDWNAVEPVLRKRVFGAHLEYRTAMPEFDWLFDSKSAWELRCSSCGEHWLMEKARGFAVSKLMHCPKCGRPVATHRWKTKKDSVQDVLIKFILRGDGRDVWIRCWRISLMIGGDDCAVAAGYEKARFLFRDGEAHKWQTTYDYHTGDYNWSEKRQITEEHWNTHPYSYTEFAPIAYFDGHVPFDKEYADFSGTCIEYSAFTEFLSWSPLLDCDAGNVEGYLALYCKHPNVEYLVKAGCTGWLEDYLKGNCRADFHKLINLRARKPKRLVKGLNFKEVQLLRHCSIPQALFYRELKETGAITTADNDARRYAMDVFTARGAYGRILDATGADAKTVRRYLTRQSSRSGIRISSLIRDWDDHLRDNIEELGLAPGTFEMFPDDLRTAHLRLQRRLKRKAKTEYVPQFHHLRRRLRPVAWESGGMFIRAIRSPMEMVAEGERQNNCVAGYQQKHAERTTYILVLRAKVHPDTPLYTVEWDAKRNTVVQCRGAGNRSLDPATEEKKNAFMKAWTSRNERLFAEGKLRDVV